MCTSRTVSVVTAVAAVLMSASAIAHIERIVIDHTQTNPAAGDVPAYEVLRGRAFGELDPKDRRNSTIQDIELAPRNARGRVEYVATFALARPADMRKSSGVLIYDVVNRGNGDVTARAGGHISLVSGWQGDVRPTPANQTIQVPVARNPDGSAITGPLLARFVDVKPGNTAPIRLGFMSASAPFYQPASLDQADATLTSSTRESPSGAREGVVTVPRDQWAFADCSRVPFPGTPDPSQLCLKDGFDPARAYQLVYTARDPLVLGVGLAATRDIVAFFRHAKQDGVGQPNPVAGAVRHAIGIGNSQSGNLIRTFIHLGFNEDQSGRRVWDGAFPRIAARQTPLNHRFAVPGGAAGPYEPGSEGVLWWGSYEDKARGRPRASLLDRCTLTRTCPKIIEAFGAAEFWGLRMSPDLIGTDAKADIPLPDDVRRYYLPGTTHGGGRGGFRVHSTPGTACELPDNPNPMFDTLAALDAALIDWVTRGTLPPPSRYPLLAKGELAPDTRAAIGFPQLPGVPFRDGLVNPVLDYDFGPKLQMNDLTGIITRQPPDIRQVIPTYVPVVNSDGNETSGVPSVLHQAPLGTYLGWNLTANGYYKGQLCGFVGGYVPFARTHAERLQANDPRASLEERYGTLEGYLCVVKRAAEAAVSNRVLLPKDAQRLISDAESTDAVPRAAASTEENRQIGRRLCTATPQS
jgi:hypothetical protein